MSRTRERLINLSLAAASLFVTLAFCEFVVFRFILPASDVPANDFVNEVVRYRPNQSGVWRVRDDVAAPYRINGQGWNSGVGDYAVGRRDGRPRVAFVGDSFVEALQVPYDRSAAEHVAGERGGEAYRFAVAGAPMSQYLHMIDREVAAYRPDWIVVILVHNDFDESFRFVPGRYTSSFRKLRIEDGRVVSEHQPAPWRQGAAEWLRRTATARFFLYRWQVRPQVLVDLLLPPARADARRIAEPHAANIDVGAVLAQEREVRAATDYLIGRMRTRAEEIGARLLLAMDGDRHAIYAGRETSAPLRLNRIAREAAESHGVAFLDLQPVFAADWQAKRRRFDFNSDNHWNEHGHAVVGHAIAAAMKTD